MNTAASECFPASATGAVREDRPQDRGAATPFLVENETAYRHWRKRKLAAFAKDLANADKPVAVADPATLTGKEHAEITRRCRRRNFAFYRITARESKPSLKRLWAQLGLRTLVANPCADEEKISSIEATPGARYIPYTTKPLKWHTDGYYNAGHDTICAFAMHCVRPGEQGGENRYFDPEILYILLRDENPDYVRALMHPQALAVPQDAEAPGLRDAREAHPSPVLALHPGSGDLIVRYTERRRFVAWRKDAATAAARAFIEQALQTPSQYRVTRRLNAGEGVVCNNVVHNRAGFTDPPGTGRLLYRARYRERIAGTGHAALPGEEQ